MERDGLLQSSGAQVISEPEFLLWCVHEVEIEKINLEACRNINN